MTLKSPSEEKHACPYFAPGNADIGLLVFFCAKPL